MKQQILTILNKKLSDDKTADAIELLYKNENVKKVFADYSNVKRRMEALAHEISIIQAEKLKNK